MPNLFIVAGCNGAGKTTASFTILPEMLDCHEFINSDEIAKELEGISPNAAIQSGKIMLAKIDESIKAGVDFAFETTLAAKVFCPGPLQRQKKQVIMLPWCFFGLTQLNWPMNV